MPRVGLRFGKVVNNYVFFSNMAAQLTGGSVCAKAELI